MFKKINKINFGKINTKIEPPFLLEIQKKSFEDFLQFNVTDCNRKIKGLEMAFRDVFPIINSDGNLILEYISYSFGKIKNTIDESIKRDLTYSVPLIVKLRLIKKENCKKEEICEQDIYFGDIPMMTDFATFIMNGVERVVVSQIHRSPGIIFEEDDEKKLTIFGKTMYVAKIIPYRGSWVEIEFDQNSILYVRIDRKRKIFITTFLRAIGFEDDSEILNFFRDKKTILLDDILNSLSTEYTAENIYNKETGKIILNSETELKIDSIKKLKDCGITSVEVWKDISIVLTLKKDQIKTQKEAVNYIYKSLKAQEFIMQERAKLFLEELLFKSTKRYDLTIVGRYKILRKLSVVFKYYKKNFGFVIPSEETRTLTKEDIIVIIKYFLMLYNGDTEFVFDNETVKISLDDIDHLGNRRIRCVGELLENQSRIGLLQVARFAKEYMNNQDKSNITPKSLINITQFVSQIRRFFGTSQLSQFMDQTNPLAELTHKRRITALGPGGLNRKRAGFEVRDVHHTHYGRICPIETPEGPNIGLITSLATFAKINQYGLIETPYKKIVNGEETNDFEYLTADKEDSFFVAQANTPLDNKGKIVSDSVQGRQWSNFLFKSPIKVDYMDVSPMQVISVSAALIPFLEHDDANRALMGCNMQRQSVPLLVAESPIVSTGIEEKVARDSGVVIVSKTNGKVISVSSDTIIIYSDDCTIEVYNLKKYLRSNQDTCINQKPLVILGDNVKIGQIIADGPSTKNGQLSLGQNVIVAYMPWDGYNFEDAMLLSEKLLYDDKFTSIHIKEFQVEARDSKGFPDEITKDVPNVGSEDLLNLDDDGIVRIGSNVNRGDILVGKTILKSEQQTTPEERLLRALFGKKAEEVQDASLRVPPGVSGKVVATRVFVRLEKLNEKERVNKLNEINSIYNIAKSDLKAIKKKYSLILEKSEKIKLKLLYSLKEKILNDKYEIEINRLKKGDDLPVSINKKVKVYIASRLKVQVGDKLAGRHGNKGVVAKILPVEDMPRLPDGTPVDCVLSPLGVPSRMNVGQLLEIMLGWAGKQLNVQMITPVFDGANEEEIKKYIEKAKNKILDTKKDILIKRGIKGDDLKKHIDKFAFENLPTDDCKITLYDGRTGKPFIEKVTIGVMYIMKLNHLAEHKIHARSTGPYSLITRQPLGGKAQFGGQRIGEMEVWALEGYGAAYTLREFLTVKSDDVDGRVNMYDSIIRGEPIPKPGIPESFKVLVSELRSLGLNIEFLNNNKKNEDINKK
jgi:DNA-directed RNA polymerase subunit beta